MATNEIFRDADHLSLPVPAGTVSGDPVTIGGLHGVAETTRGEGGNPTTHASVWLKGAHRFTVDAAVTVGAPVYHAGTADTREAGLTTTKPSDGNTDPFGHAIETTTDAGPAAVRIA